MTVQQLYEKKIGVIKKGIDLVRKGAPFTLPFEEYSNFFEFSIKALHEKPTQIHYKDDPKFRIIEEIIGNHDAYLFLNFSSFRIVSWASSKCIASTESPENSAPQSQP